MDGQVAALKEDTTEVVRLMPAVVNTSKLKKTSFRDWPVFDYVKEKPEFQIEYEKIFGEPYQNSGTATTIDVPKSEYNSDSISKEETRH